MPLTYVKSVETEIAEAVAAHTWTLLHDGWIEHIEDMPGLGDGQAGWIGEARPTLILNEYHTSVIHAAQDATQTVWSLQGEPLSAAGRDRIAADIWSSGDLVEIPRLTF